MTETTPRNQAALDFLLSRRSRPHRTLEAPVPETGDLHEILTAAARTPDHGKLEPWRFIVLSGEAMRRLAELAVQRGRELGKSDEETEKMRAQYAGAPMAVALIFTPKEPIKVPVSEQRNSAAAACLALLNAALAAGWGANWLTGWPAHDQEFGRQGLSLSAGEEIVGFVHIGTARAVPPERPRPDIEALTTWVTS